MWQPGMAIMTATLPEPKTLIPPLLACLPAAFVSPQPPPALLQLVSPILHQRIKLLSDTSSSQSKSSWLTLLCWNADEASRVECAVENGVFEPHPNSGEIELGEIASPKFRQLDKETLQSCINITDFGLQAIYVWCETDPEGSAPNWRLSELRSMEDSHCRVSQEWSSTVEEASQRMTDHQPATFPVSRPDRRQASPAGNEHDSLDDDDYWAQYDDTPVRTPAVKRSPAFGTSADAQIRVNQSMRDEYFERYAQVQPEMDNDDPSVDRNDLGESSLHGHEVVGTQTSLIVEDADGLTPSHLNDPRGTGIAHTRSSSSSSFLVAQLEKSVESTVGTDLASIAVQQHISTSMKSLYRLAKGAGIAQGEFQRLIHTELEVLSMLDGDD